VEHIEFIKALNRIESKYVTLQAAAETIKVAEAIIASSTTGEAIKL
jgi:hypothetical protein